MKYETCTDCKEQEKIGHKWAGTIYLPYCLVCGNIDIVLEEKNINNSTNTHD